MVKCILEKRTIQCLEDWLKCQDQKFVACAPVSSWQLVTCGIFQGTILRPMMFNVFINDLDYSMEYTLKKLTDYSNLGGIDDSEVAGMLTSRTLAECRNGLAATA